MQLTWYVLDPEVMYWAPKQVQRSGSSRGSRAAKDQKLALIREMKAQLLSGERQPLDADASKRVAGTWRPVRQGRHRAS